jgi:hypothetical protein
VQLAIGASTAAFLDFAAEEELMGGHWAVILPLVSLAIGSVGLVAALGPAREGLRINPTEALRAE